jgi:hypothetical protein
VNVGPGSYQGAYTTENKWNKYNKKAKSQVKGVNNKLNKGEHGYISN